MQTRRKTVKQSLSLTVRHGAIAIAVVITSSGCATLPRNAIPVDRVYEAEIPGFARVSAAVRMHVSDYYTQGRRSFFRLHEKGGKHRVVPAHHVAQAYVDAYIDAAAAQATPTKVTRKRMHDRACPDPE